MKRYLLISFLFLASITSGQIPVAKKGTFVNDLAGVLTASDIKALNQKIFIIQKEAKVQLAIVLINKLPAGYTIKSYANGIGRKWHVGVNKKGLVYVAAIEEHAQRLAVAQNLRTTFTASKSDEILSAMKTAYRNNDYAGGLNILVNKVHVTLVPQAEVKQEAKPVLADSPVNKAEKEKVTGKEESSDILPGVIFFSVLILAIVIFYYRGKLRQARLTAETLQRMQEIQGVNYNQGSYSGGGVRSYSGGFGGARRQPVQGGRRSSAGSFLTGAALGAAGGYGARYLQDKLNEKHDGNHDTEFTSHDSFANDAISEDNNESNWGNWGSGDQSSDSGFSDNSSSDSNDTSYDNSSSGDSGFSDSSDDSSSGSTSNW